ncbi:MAG: ester cyclase [candidate division Zixibacteria bacterium]|nr:ester cyclase [candidate division Zixibacteria bacterium]MBU1471041.1 ester cyclase [candidate division Zixibacteria bacterium]MBU2625076.1 ester cyclase [candidate division Zixibacteria bacterium]
MSRNALAIVSLTIVVCFGFMAGCCDQNASMEEQNQLVVVEITEQGVNMQNPDKWDDVLTPGYVRHCQAMPPELQEMTGINEMKKFLAEHFAAFPDWNEQIDFMLADGDKVAYITTDTGTHTGQMGPYAATGKSVNVKTFIIHRFEDGKIAESWVMWDNVAFLSQLGLFIPAEPTADMSKLPSESQQIKIDTPKKKIPKGSGG